MVDIVNTYLKATQVEPKKKSPIAAAKPKYNVKKMLRTLSAGVLLFPSAFGSYEHKALTDVNTTMEEIRMAKTIAESFPDRDSDSINVGYVGRVLKQADIASKELDIPKEFVVNHWLMESGALCKSAMEKNNLAGIQNGDKLIKFDSLEDFRAQYVKTLKKDNVTHMNDPWEIVNKLHKAHYFMDNAEKYANNILGDMEKSSFAGANYQHYYVESFKTMWKIKGILRVKQSE